VRLFGYLKRNVLCWFNLRFCCLVAAIEPWRVEIFWSTNLDQTVRNHKNSLDRKNLKLPISRFMHLRLYMNEMWIHDFDGIIQRGNVFQCHFAHHKSYVEWPEIELRSPRWQTGNQNWSRTHRVDRIIMQDGLKKNWYSSGLCKRHWPRFQLKLRQKTRESYLLVSCMVAVVSNTWLRDLQSHAL
jgi:hypothetical protein